MTVLSLLTRAGVSLLLAAVTCAPHAARGQPPEVGAGDSRAFAFVGVSVVPMDSKRVLENQTVIVRDGCITQVTPAAQTNVRRGRCWWTAAASPTTKATSR